MSTPSVVVVIERAKIEAINREHHLCEQAYADALTHAVTCGSMLAAVKADLRHGEWGPWLKAHFEGSDRTAQVYMQLASVPIENRSASADLPTSIAGALKQVSTPRAPRAASPREAIGMVGGLEDDDDPAASRASAPDDSQPSAWTDQHSRRRVRVAEMLTDAIAGLERASDPGLSPVAVAELLRSAEIKARQASAQLGELAFSFER